MVKSKKHFFTEDIKVGKLVGELETPEKQEKAKKQQRNHRGGAVKYDGGKPQMSLVPTLAMIEVAKIMTHGAEKYAPYNWTKGFDYSKLVDAAERHIAAFKLGEDIDPESGFHHLGHALCCIMMLYDNTKLHPELDDRFKGYKEFVDAIRSSK